MVNKKPKISVHPAIDKHFTNSKESIIFFNELCWCFIIKFSFFSSGLFSLSLASSSCSLFKLILLSSSNGKHKMEEIEPKITTQKINTFIYFRYLNEISFE